MKFLEIAKQDKSSIGLYLGGLALLIVLYILGNLPLLLDIKLNFPGLLFDPENPGFISSYGSLRLLLAYYFHLYAYFLDLYVTCAMPISANGCISSPQQALFDGSDFLRLAAHCLYF